MSFKLWEAGRLNREIGRIGRVQGLINKLSQECATQAVAWSILHGDIMPLRQVLAALGEQARKDAFVAFAEKFAPVRWNGNGKKGELIYFKRELEWNDAYAKLVSETAWWTCKKPTAITSQYDVQEKLASFIDSLRKKLKSGCTVAHAELLGLVEQTYVQYVSAQALRAAKAAQDAIDEKAAKADAEVNAMTEAFRAAKAA